MNNSLHDIKAYHSCNLRFERIHIRSLPMYLPRPCQENLGQIIEKLTTETRKTCENLKKSKLTSVKFTRTQENLRKIRFLHFLLVVLELEGSEMFIRPKTYWLSCRCLSKVLLTDPKSLFTTTDSDSRTAALCLRNINGLVNEWVFGSAIGLSSCLGK